MKRLAFLWRHLMVPKVKKAVATFGKIAKLDDGKIIDSTVPATIDVASINPSAPLKSLMRETSARRLGCRNRSVHVEYVRISSTA